MSQASQELIEHTAQQGQVMTMGGRPALAAGVNVGAVSIEQERAIAEAQGQLIMAKRFPRNLNAAYEELLDACKIPAFANVAFFTVPQGGSKVTGLSIRFAEECARVYCNFEYGHRELSRIEAGPGPKDFGRSEVEIYAWDKQSNNRLIRQLTVLHVLDTKDGPRKLRDQKDIDNKIANVASKQMRGRILAMMPKWMIEAAAEECKKTINGNNTEPLSVRARKMTGAFAGYGVSVAHLERYLGHSLDDILLDELTNLIGVYNALKDGTPASEFFAAAEAEAVIEQTGAALAASAKASQQAANEPQTSNVQPIKAKTTAKPAAAKPAAAKPAADAQATTTAVTTPDAAAEPEKATAPVVEAQAQQQTATVTEAAPEAQATGTDDGDDFDPTKDDVF